MKIVLEDGRGVRVWEGGASSPGAGPPLLLLHGFTGSVEAWGPELLEELAAGRRVVAVDLPGHGCSDLPPPGGLALEAVVEDLCRTLDRLAVDQAVWGGYSMGGRVALGAAVLRRERVAGLVLESASPGLATEEERDRRGEQDARRAAALRSVGIEAWVDEWMALPLFASQRSLPDGVLHRERERRLGNRVEGLARTLLELGTGSQPSFWEELHRIPVPVLLLTGAEDAKFCRLADAMADRLPRVHRTTVPGAGHAVHLERPREWSAAVRRFLQGMDDETSHLCGPGLPTGRGTPGPGGAGPGRGGMESEEGARGRSEMTGDATARPRGGEGEGALVGVISDTHGLLRPEAVAALEGADLIVHAGDVGDPAILEALAGVAPVHAVRGNVDRGPWARALPRTEVVEVAGRRLYVLHIVEDLDLDPAAAEMDAVVFGHSHRPAVERRGGVLFLNPGSAGPRRFDRPVSVARLRVGPGGLEAEIVELLDG